MADTKGRKLARLAASGDPEAGIQLAHHAARAKQPELLSEGILASISLLGLSDLRKLQYAIGAATKNILTKDRKENPHKHQHEKAVEFSSSALGRVSLGEFVAAIEDFVTSCAEGNAEKDKNPYIHRTSTRNYGPPLSKKACADKAFEVLNKYVGDFVISSSGPIRIYAVKEAPSPEVQERRRKEREKANLERELEIQKTARNKLVKQLETQKLREARLKKKLEEMA